MVKVRCGRGSASHMKLRLPAILSETYCAVRLLLHALCLFSISCYVNDVLNHQDDGRW